MDSMRFLRQELQDVEHTLKESLRREFLHDQVRDYYEECRQRLEDIRQTVASSEHSDPTFQESDAQIALGSLARYISLVERSHLGEFSWPFAQEIRRVANTVFLQQLLGSETTTPIVHIIAEGTEYSILNEDQPADFGQRPFMIVAFPRHRKHQVLLHATFGHELGHPAIHAAESPGYSAFTHLTKADTLRSVEAISNWLSSDEAPSHVKESRGGSKLEKNELNDWCKELFCDLFGLAWLGPCFAAAHRTLLEHRPNRELKDHKGQSTHPPYTIRRRMLCEAMSVMKYSEPSSCEEHFQASEKEFLQYAAGFEESDGKSIVPKAILKVVMGMICEKLGAHSYKAPSKQILSTQMERLVNARPPIVQIIRENGELQVEASSPSNILYSGWCAWLGIDHFKTLPIGRIEKTDETAFSIINKLCDHALLQRNAIMQYQKYPEL